MSKTYTYLATLVGVVCVYFIIRLIFFPRPRTVRSDVMQGILIGFGLAFVTAQIYARIKATKGQRLDHHVRIRRARQRHVAASRARPVISRPGERTARGDVLVDEHRWRGPCALRSARLRHALSGRRTSAEQCILVDYDGRCEKSLCGESDQSVQRQRPVRSRAKRRRFGRYLHSERRSGRARVQLAARAGRQFHPLAARVHTRSRPFSTASITVPPVVEVK